MFSRRSFLVWGAVLAVGSLAALPGCDWLQGSGSGSDSRLSPFLSSLSVRPSAVLCDQAFTVSFHYDDPQGDISTALVSLQRSGDPATREESPPWTEATGKNNGTFSVPLSFACDSKGGVWTITVKVEDSRGHTSNTLSGEIRLNAAG